MLSETCWISAKNMLCVKAFFPQVLIKECLDAFEHDLILQCDKVAEPFFSQKDRRLVHDEVAFPQCERVLGDILLGVDEVQQPLWQLRAQMHKARGIRSEQDLRAAIAVNDAVIGVQRQHRGRANRTHTH